MGATQDNRIPQEGNFSPTRSSYFLALERADVEAAPRGMYSRAMRRAYSESTASDCGGRAAGDRPPALAEPARGPVVWAALHTATPKRPRRRVPRAASAAVTLGAVVGLAVAVWPGGPAGVAPPSSAVVHPAAMTMRPPEAPRAEYVPIPTAPDGTPRAAEPVAAVHDPAARRMQPRATDGVLVVRSEPSGARVMVNGVGWGETPITIRYVPFGAKDVRVVLSGYRSAERRVTLDAEQPAATVRVRLQASRVRR